MTNLTFHLDDGIFNVRAAGIVLHDGRVLLHKAGENEFWTLPGGRVAFGEDSATALAREIAEELGVAAVVERLLWFAEHHVLSPLFGKQLHELGFYFLMTLPPDAPMLHNSDTFVRYEEDGTPLLFGWHPLADLHNLKVLPGFLVQGLNAPLPPMPIHLVNKNP